MSNVGGDIEMKNINEQIFQQIDKANNILITGAVKWNEEIIAGGLALQKFLTKINKKSDVIFDFSRDKVFIHPQVNQFSILTGFENIKTKYSDKGFVISLDTSKTKIDKIKYKANKNSLDFFITPKLGTFSSDDVKTLSNFDYDLIIVLGTSDIDSMSLLYQNSIDLFYEVPVINIDNKASNEEFGQINLIDLVSSSVSEILFSLFFKHNKNLIDKDISNCLLSGIVYATKNFKSNITPNTLTNTTNLMSLGADKNKIVEKLYKSFSFDLLRLWGKALSRIKEHSNTKRLVWTTILENDFSETKMEESSLIRLFSEIKMNLPDFRIVVIFYEKKIDNKLYSNALIYCCPSLNIANIFAGCNTSNNNGIFQINSEKSISNFQKDVIRKILQVLDID